MKDDIDISETFTFEQTHSNIAIGIFEHRTGKMVYDEKYMNLTALMFIADRVNTPYTEEYIPIALRRCVMDDVEKFFPDVAPGIME